MKLLEKYLNLDDIYKIVGGVVIIGLLVCLYCFKDDSRVKKYSDKITIGIPCIPKHVRFLNELIGNINDQELLPKEIIISLSESNEDDGILLEQKLNDISYSSIRVITSKDKKYAGENRNICGQYCNTGLISFIDSDDLMCPSRIKVVEEVFDRENYDVLFHNYTNSQLKCSNDYGKINRKEVTTKQYHSNNITDENKGVLLENVHHGHLTIRKDILKKYPIDIHGYGEDTRYLHKLFKNDLNVISLPDYYGTIYRQEYSSWK